MRLDDREASRSHDRRQFLASASVALAGLVLARRAGAAPQTRALSFVNTHTDETVSVVYWAEGGFEPQALREIDHILRDHRTGEVKPVDVQLLDLLHDLRARFRATAPFHVISGYRSPATNAMLHERSGSVARHSLHLDARAADVRLPGTALPELRRAALALRRGGVGYYPGPDFVHVDTGRPRSW